MSRETVIGPHSKFFNSSRWAVMKVVSGCEYRYVRMMGLSYDKIPRCSFGIPFISKPETPSDDYRTLIREFQTSPESPPYAAEFRFASVVPSVAGGYKTDIEKLEEYFIVESIVDIKI